VAREYIKSGTREEKAGRENEALILLKNALDLIPDNLKLKKRVELLENDIEKKSGLKNNSNSNNRKSSGEDKKKRKEMSDYDMEADMDSEWLTKGETEDNDDASYFYDEEEEEEDTWLFDENGKVKEKRKRKRKKYDKSKEEELRIDGKKVGWKRKRILKDDDETTEEEKENNSDSKVNFYKKYNDENDDFIKRINSIQVNVQSKTTNEEALAGGLSGKENMAVREFNGTNTQNIEAGTRTQKLRKVVFNDLESCEV
jgi:hypothetical protein